MYFAKINENNIVEQVIVADQNFINSMPGTWIETYIDGSLRKNYAGIGHLYDSNRDAFIAPKPFPSWILNESTCRWEAPVPYPQSGIYNWSEEDLNWVEVI